MTRFLDIGWNNSLVGMILFARHANIHFHVKEHWSKTQLIADINEIVYDQIPELNRTGTNMPQALDLLRTEA